MARRPTVELVGLKELRDTFSKRAPKEAAAAADDTVLEIAKVVESRIFRRMQNFARTGRLAHSIFTRRRQQKDGIAQAEVRGGATAPYMLIAEFGTSRTTAQPSIVPSVEETRPELPALMSQLFGQRLEKRLKK